MMICFSQVSVCDMQMTTQDLTWHSRPRSHEWLIFTFTAICSGLGFFRRREARFFGRDCDIIWARNRYGKFLDIFGIASMEVNSSLYNLEYISDSMEQKDRGSHCCTGE